MQNTQSYFMMFAYGVFLFGSICTGIGWFFFKIRAMSNKPAWDGIGGSLIKFGIITSIIGVLLVGLALYLLGNS